MALRHPPPNPSIAGPGQIAQGVERHTCVCVGVGGSPFSLRGRHDSPAATAASLEKFVRGLLGAVAQVTAGRRKCDCVCECVNSHTS